MNATEQEIKLIDLRRREEKAIVLKTEKSQGS